MNTTKSVIKSKTIWGVFLTFLPQVIDLASSGALGPKATLAASAIGAALAVFGRAKATRPIRMRPGANLLMFALVALIALPGCVSRPTAPGEPPPAPVAKEFLALAKPLAEGFATAMLANNPKYASVVCGVAEGFGLAMQQTELTPEMVDAFTAKLRRDHPELDPTSYALVKGFIVGSYDLWRARYGPLLPTDAQAAEILTELQAVLQGACDNVKPPG